MLRGAYWACTDLATVWTTEYDSVKPSSVKPFNLMKF